MFKMLLCVYSALWFLWIWEKKYNAVDERRERNILKHFPRCFSLSPSNPSSILLFCFYVDALRFIYQVTMIWAPVPVSPCPDWQGPIFVGITHLSRRFPSPSHKVVVDTEVLKRDKFLSPQPFPIAQSYKALLNKITSAFLRIYHSYYRNLFHQLLYLKYLIHFSL